MRWTVHVACIWFVNNVHSWNDDLEWLDLNGRILKSILTFWHRNLAFKF
jgi:hypothetical protein